MTKKTHTLPASTYLPPLIPPAAALVAGIAAGRAFTFFPYATCAASALILAVLFFINRIKPVARIISVVVFLLGFGAYFGYGPGAGSYLDGFIGTGPVEFTGEVIRPPQEMDGYTVLYLRTDTPSSLSVRPGTVRVTVSGKPGLFSYGDVLRGPVELSKPEGFRNPGTFDWGGYARLNGVDAVAKAKPDTFARLGNRAGPVMGRVYAFRRSVAKKAARSLSPDTAALFQAIILGEQSGVTRLMRDTFATSGTTHILSVSGSHIALLTGFLFMVSGLPLRLLPARRALRFSLHVDVKKAAAAIAIPASVMYCLIAGSELATVRSVIMVTVFMVAILAGRAGDLLNILATAAIITLAADPSSLFDISFQLSYISVLFIALALISMRDWKPPEGKRLSRVDRLKRYALYTAVMSTAAIAGTAPLVAGQFNSFSLMALPANMVVIPVAGMLTVPLGLFTCLVDALFPGPGLPLAWLNSAALVVFYRLVELFGSYPAANLHPPAPGPVTALLYYAVVLGVLTWRAGLARKGLAAGLVIAVFSVTPYIHHTDGGKLRVTFLDVGQGDCSLVRFPDGRTMLVDSGGSEWGIDPGRATVAPYLWNSGIRRLDYAALTHPHPDHAGGFACILSHFDAGQVWEGTQETDGDAYRAFRDAAAKSGAARHVVTKRGGLDVGGAKLQILHTPAVSMKEMGKGKDTIENNRSLVMRISYGDVSFLFAGDCEKAAQHAMLTANPPLPLRSTVLKVPHHGSADAAHGAFINAVSPSIAVVSTGRHNRFGHPSPVMAGLLKQSGATLYNTADDGAVTVETDGKGVRVRTYRETAPVPAKSWDGELANWARVTGG